MSTSVRGPVGLRGARRLIRAVAVPTLALILATQAPAPAEAQEKPARSKRELQAAARTRGEEGLRLFEAKQWAEAYTAFHEANELFHAATLVLFMGHCRRNMGKLIEARALYRSVSNEELPKIAPTQFRKAQATASEELTALSKRIPSLKISLTGQAAEGARVALDGTTAPVVELAAGKEIDPGDHTIVVDARGEPSIERSIAVPEGGVTEVEIAVGPSALSGSSHDRRRGSIVPGGVAMGVGAAGVGVGAVTGLLAMVKIDDIKSRCRSDGHCLKADQPGADAAQTLVTVSTIGFITGGVALVTGAVLMVIRPGGRGDPKPPDTGVQVSIGLGSIGIGGVF